MRRLNKCTFILRPAMRPPIPMGVLSHLQLTMFGHETATCDLIFAAENFCRYDKFRLAVCTSLVSN